MREHPRGPAPDAAGDPSSSKGPDGVTNPEHFAVPLTKIPRRKPSEGVMPWRQVEAALVHYARSNRIEVIDHCGMPSIAVHRSKFNDERTTFGLEALAKFLAGELGQ
jgi:hypothetical protein